ncbi:GalNAc-alpha-(1-_4)-GalNAc-alpha-(1-_3)-diNAcBac-PP-undecaprenol alpha-1,4-N-acetyl-D-galactosaminyltransferase [Pandoraea terrae]|uniref:GalNAc-alpha-(1->4)-GalNAc-alpha-(1->3)-diNAcBac-PP-undecaprenol alpha-1,4-N-acetyl-D-galactosaminyltransferase n=1 Tax=Pandoraea terrae TaxID=1537710 RepID=A0A5E4TR57_9BURK|nr:glycosyltransferase family 4 protein [Pandoraea terrae]VVD89094.1 GalNAc-alpha-(1->4)-GalNAc-alpha-(1->3)-diNAcBac-PP-undecaprenol alpha-1,4-N-acetyl-D-galactosaminyltransferase [Pandoraea terrae]
MTLPPICFLTGTLSAFAGAERATATLANALAARGHRVHILAQWGRTPVFPLAPGVTHHALFDARVSFKRHFAATVCGIRRYLREHAIGTLVDVDPMLAWFTEPATFGLPVRRIAWEHSTYASDLGRKSRRYARRLAAARADAVVTLTDDDTRAWRRHHPRARANIVTIPNPLGISPPPVRNTLDAPVVLAVGRLVVAKGFDLLLRAWTQVAPDAPGWRLRIVGDGPMDTVLRDQARDDGIADRVDFIPATSDIATHYASASVYCLSSRQESFGLVLIEAQAFGLPIVAFAADAGPRSLLTDGVDSLIAPAGDVDALAAGLRRFIGSHDLREQFGRAGFVHARRFTPDAIAALWEPLLAGGGRP